MEALVCHPLGKSLCSSLPPGKQSANMVDRHHQGSNAIVSASARSRCTSDFAPEAFRLCMNSTHAPARHLNAGSSRLGPRLSNEKHRWVYTRVSVQF
jgi:hypothetical protein